MRRTFLLVILALSLLRFPHAWAADAPVVIDWTKGDVQDTPASCGPFRFEGMQDHRAYTLWVRGNKSGACTFEAEGLTFHLPPNYGPTTNSKTTAFSFVRIGDDVLTSWQPGY